jgi:hypothetical protein
MSPNALDEMELVPMDVKKIAVVRKFGPYLLFMPILTITRYQRVAQ